MVVLFRHARNGSIGYDLPRLDSPTRQTRQSTRGKSPDVSEDRRAVGPGEAARRLSVSTRTVQRWLLDGRLGSVRVGQRLKVDGESLAAMLAASGQASAPLVEGSATPARGAPVTRPISRLLIANRGEMVVRIARTCDELGITSLALVAPDQARAWWAKQADEMVPLPGTYLDADAVLEAARRSRADAIHPGYGFLAENAAFADAVEAAGLLWVGPPGAAMRALGDKAAGRRLAASVDVPVLPGYDGSDQLDVALSRAATKVGYPLLVKPSAGGGGKGMHVAGKAAELPEILARARREALAAFGDERLILERYVEAPRHVEVQFLVDRHGGAVHLGERDCSLQRRHQKVIEEAPSPAVDHALRRRLGDAALRLAGAAGYVNAGTAEFLLDRRGDVYFVEVNARLQVEHPVSEVVTGRDLVADQLRIAAGETLGFGQGDVRWEGHAVEARLYAEDPWSGFMPAAGPVVEVRWPDGDGVRTDAGVGAGDVIGTRYDPLLAKIVATGTTREEALSRLDAALAATSVIGVTTNRGFLRGLISTPEFRAGNATTDLIERTWRPGAAPSTEPAFRAAAAALAQAASSTGSVSSGFRLNARPEIRVAIDEEQRSIELDARALADLAWAIDPGAPLQPAVVVDIDGRAVRANVAPAPTVEDAIEHARREIVGTERVIAPMPGSVLSVRVSAGDHVEAGQTLLVLEAMKMENAVTAPVAGTIEQVLAEPGQQVERGEVLVELR
jgi:excisionase family DNA binding protein